MPDLMDDITALAKRRGLIFQSSEIYGGLRSCWDYGPLGVELKRNVKDAWWRSMVQLRDDVVGLDASILMSPKVWETSGHVAGFTDPLVECADCRRRFRADHVTSEACPECGGVLSEPRRFNLMFETHMGPVADESHKVYLRPETAQGIFVDFAIVQQSSRKKVPFGIAQIGKSFRNEITPGNFTFRTREFEQMEMEFFVEPGSDDGWLTHWIEERRRWYLDLGLREEKLRIRKHDDDELAHYAKETHDFEYEFPFGWSELEGVANRTDYDLRAHMEASGQDLRYFDQENETHYVPFVIEPAAGADRATLAFLVDAYRVEEAPNAKGEMEKRTLLRLHKDLAPLKVAVLPLSRKETLAPEARRVYDIVKGRWMSDYDDAGSIGRRYRRQDEVGTPYCVTVDFDTLDDAAVTVRDRDTMAQDRIAIDALTGYLAERLDGPSG